jgi:hypothetical protein
MDPLRGTPTEGGAVPNERKTESPASGLFVCGLLRREKYRYNWGWKWFSARIRDAIIRLPADTSGEVDWLWIEDYMASLPLSSAILKAADGSAGTKVS